MMKILLTYLCILTCVSKGFSQVQPDPYANNFVGTWKWVSGNDEVTIILEKQVSHNPLTGVSSEGLVGWHKYVKNGLLIQSSLQHQGRDVNIDFNSTDPDLKTTLRGFGRSSTKAFFYTFWDLSMHKTFVLNLEFLPGSTTQLNWTLTEPPGIYTGPPGTANLFTLPKSIVLTKQ